MVHNNSYIINRNGVNCYLASAIDRPFFFKAVALIISTFSDHYIFSALPKLHIRNALQNMKCIGIYQSLHGKTHQGHPVYKQENGEMYLYYNNNQWSVGKNFGIGSDEGSVILQADSGDIETPDKVNTWHEWNNRKQKWMEAPYLQVKHAGKNIH